MEKKFLALLENLSRYKHLLLAFSGGLDSSFLTMVASQVIPGTLLAVTIVTPLLARRDEERARKVINELGVEYLQVQMELPFEVYANHPNRCYVCKKEIFKRLLQIGKERQIENIAHGANQDDLLDYRPGEKAAYEYHIKAPLQEVGLTKEEIRSLARSMGLPIWDEPATVCLASRVSYGLELTRERLDFIAGAEEYLRQFFSSDLRVRIHDEKTIRLEVNPEELPEVLAHREEILSYLRQGEYPYLTLDLHGYKMGSMNRMLEVEE